MNYIEQRIPGVWVIEPVVYQDERGYFMETFRQDEFQQHTGIVFNIVQENQSKSMMGVLRGLHFQKGEYSQAKLVKVLSGAVWDVAVDLRRSSPTFGQYVIVELSEQNHRQLYIPLCFAHGFLVKTPYAVFSYKVDNFYAPQAEGAVNYADPTLGVQWPFLPLEYTLSEKDRMAPFLPEAYTFD